MEFNKTAILESKIEQLEMEVNRMKCCGNCFYGTPTDEGIKCMDKSARRQQHHAQSYRCDSWDLLPGGID